MSDLVVVVREVLARGIGTDLDCDYVSRRVGFGERRNGVIRPRVLFGDTVVQPVLQNRMFRVFGLASYVEATIVVSIWALLTSWLSVVSAGAASYFAFVVVLEMCFDFQSFISFPVLPVAHWNPPGSLALLRREIFGIPTFVNAFVRRPCTWHIDAPGTGVRSHSTRYPG